VIAAHNSNHNLFYRDNTGMAYGPSHLDIAQCCPGTVNRVMPTYGSRMWMKDANNGFVAALYGPSKVTFPVGDHQRRLTDHGEYAVPIFRSDGFHHANGAGYPIPLHCADSGLV
jgi:DUF1680 family protein